MLLFKDSNGVGTWHDFTKESLVNGMNAKGQPLTQADLIRNYVFMRIPADEQENQYTRYWLPMQEKLGDQLTEFIRHYLLGININVKKSDVYVKFKEKVDGQDVIAFLATLSKFASYYTNLLNPSLEDHTEIRKHLTRITEFEAKTAYPFLLYIYRDYKDNKYNAELSNKPFLERESTLQTVTCK